MDGKDKSNLNQIILILLAPPYYLIAVNIVKSLITDTDAGLLNVHHYKWTILWIIPFLVINHYRNSKNIWFTTKAATALTMLIGITLPFIQTYNWIYTLGIGFGAVYFTWFLCRPKLKEPKEAPDEYAILIDAWKQTYIPSHFFNENTQIIGSTGSGKTHFVIKPIVEQTIKQNLGCFVLDVKSNLYKDVFFYADQANRQDSVRYFDLARPEYSDTYNPLYGSNPDEIANRVFTALYYNIKTSEPFYQEVASAFITNLIGLLMTEIETLTFQDLATATGELGSFKTISDFCARHSDTPQARYFQDLWLNKPVRERQMELTGLVNKLQRFCNREWSPLVNVRNPKIRMNDVLGDDQVFILGTHSMKYSEDSKPLAIMAMMDLSSHIAERFAHPIDRPFRVFLDEFYNIAYPGFINLINKCRESKVNLFLAHQSLGDLRAVSEEFKEQVMNTARNKIILGVDDPDTAEHFSRLLGTEPDMEAQVVSYDADEKVAGFAIPQVEKFRFHPNEIKEMPVGEAIVRLVPKKEPLTFRTALGTATPPPDGFDPFLDRQAVKPKDRRNETSIILAPAPEPKADEPKKEDSTVAMLRR